MSDAESEALWRIVHVAQIYVASTTSIWIWDWLVCLPEEWKYIWKAQWSAIKMVYLMVRYYALAVLIMTDIWVLGVWTEESCSRYLRILPAFAVLVELSVELVLVLRVYALWGRNKWLLIFLSLMMLGFTGVMVSSAVLSFGYTKLPAWPGPCLITQQPSIAGPNFIVAFFASPMVVDFTLTAMTIWRGLRHRASGSTSRPINIFIKHHVLYFVAISSLNLINVVFFLQKNKLIQSLNVAISIQLSTVLSCRLILNLRANRDRSGKINKFSDTHGRWMTDFQADTSDDLDPSIVLSARPPLVRSAEIPRKEDQPSVINGIVVRWEQEVNYADQWGNKKRASGDPEHGDEPTAAR
ncbi:uncharacterized protein STEHIDRAFT_150848 [Stereum hirsutum FP-91666 SS1]|uniref:DUF6533 domain-containing protein n=1 Tax=Stereum hirsutum (strain FP-91666) TaxID=721885 RepID=R7RXD0_STEHR|nr:uncharacterized protein STEHIDRAFT_150848 [Stereum hirsutum FP-91666 SS1]EIM80014.1 hypothetical protein STEHIDRAFT_150848 [Stereum hirsutum FP-91666 SS1]